MGKAECSVCFRHCRLKEGETGFCGSRICVGGTVRPAWYGRISSLALDPIEKKPLQRFHPGSRILIGLELLELALGLGRAINEHDCPVV